MKRIGTAVFCMILGALLSVGTGLATGLILTKTQAEHQMQREEMRAQVITMLKQAREDYNGPVKANGCYTFAHNDIQSIVTHFHFTAAELDESANKLLCYGWTMPEDLFK
jgi:hypothetical protein